MLTKAEFSEIKKGDHFRVQGSPGPFVVALEDAIVDRRRGVCFIKTTLGTYPALGHTHCELRK